MNQERKKLYWMNSSFQMIDLEENEFFSVKSEEYSWKSFFHFFFCSISLFRFIRVLFRVLFCLLVWSTCLESQIFFIPFLMFSVYSLISSLFPFYYSIMIWVESFIYSFLSLFGIGKKDKQEETKTTVEQEESKKKEKPKSRSKSNVYIFSNMIDAARSKFCLSLRLRRYNS